MKTQTKTLVLPILLIAVGIGWLLTTMHIVPEVNWVWTLGLGVSGILMFVGGINKGSIVLGPLLLIASGLSILRQTDQLEIEHEIPILLIALGCLLLIARSPKIPIPDWYVEHPGRRD